MSFGNYLKTLLKFTISASLSVSILACILILILGVPVIVVLVVAVISPLSFLIHRLSTRQGVGG